MNWTAPIDIYCERLDPAFWAEPLNALSNAAFILAAMVLWRAAGRAGRLRGMGGAMAAIVAVIGVGSFLFHTFAQRWSMAADVIPILTFILVFIWAATRDFLGASRLASWGAVGAALVFTAAFIAAWGRLLPGVQASQSYLPVLVIIIFYAVLLARRGHPATSGMVAAAAVFSVSLTFRSLDAPLCAAAPMGLHFIWHMLNGVLLAIVGLTYIRHGARRVEQADAAV